MTPLERAWRGSRNDWRLHLLSVFSVAVAFVCLGSVLLGVTNIDAIRQRWASTGRVSVFLRPAVTPEAVADLERALRGTPDVTAVRLVSSGEARKELIASSHDEIFEDLPEEAFPTSIELGVREAVEAERLAELSRQLTSLPVVESVETYQAWSERLGRLLMGGVTASLIMALVVFAAVVSVVSSTIRLSLARRRIEVEVLKLVGATDSYVRRPFVVEGATQGAVGAVLAVALLGALYGVVRGHFDGGLGTLLGVSPTFLSWFSICGLVLLGGLLGALSAYGSLRRLLQI